MRSILRGDEIVIDNRSMKLLIVDDHPVVRDGLAALLRQLGPDVTVLLADGSAQGLGVADTHPDLDIVILDLAMPESDGFAALDEFGRLRPQLPVVVLSSSEDPRDVRRALASGALGYIPKSAPPRTILAALQFVLAGNVYVPTLLAHEAASASPKSADDLAPRSDVRLTSRQTDVLRLLSEGRSNKEIGLALGLSQKTVKVHVTAIFKALSVGNRIQAVAAANKAGLI
jgi:two-component system, NarL family, nitrate/nitrite response regulator NarL